MATQTRKESILDGNSLTPLNREEATLSGVDLQPLTREEMFLQKILKKNDSGEEEAGEK